MATALSVPAAHPVVRSHPVDPDEVDPGEEAGQWSDVARRLVHSLAVPRWLLAGPPECLGSVRALQSLGAAEPLLMAAAAEHRGWPEVVEVALRRAEAAPDPDVADLLSLALLRLVRARSQGRGEEGLAYAHRAQSLLGELTLVQRAAAPELNALLQSHAGAFALWSGRLEQARAAFERGGRGFQARPDDHAEPLQIATASCVGQGAWLNAVCGNLSRALRVSADVLTARPADSSETGVVHAQLATIWVQVARSELQQASQRFDALLSRTDREPDPGLAAAIWLTGLRLAVALGDPRIDRAATPLDHSVAGDGWFRQQIGLARAEAELSAGQPDAALELLGGEDRVPAEVSVLRARAWLAVGDLAAAAAELRSRPVEPLPLLTQVQLELVEARLAHAHGRLSTQRALIDRALRAAGREQLRTPIAWAKSWLHSALATDPALLQLHGSFLASIRTAPEQAAAIVPDRALSAPEVDLSDRELEILQRLGSLSTNNEIAAELFLSTNTVKTHLKSLYRKLDVTRRSDAFRRGRSLGLC